MTPTPFYADRFVTLYHGDALEVLPALRRAGIRPDACVTDPPYGATDLEWDTWPSGWPGMVAALTSSLWCFGSLRMFFDRLAEFGPWQLAQDVVWEKHNGTNMAADRFRRVHELAVHWYQGSWSAVHKELQYTNDATAKQVRRKQKPPQWGAIADSTYVSEDGGPRQMTSVIYARGCHGSAVNETQKPEGAIAPLVAFSVPRGGLVLDPFAGSGTMLAVAAREGRRAIGIEIRREQCERIVERLAQGSLALGGPS